MKPLLIRIHAAMLLLSWSFALTAQNDLANHKKYWYYKSRLNNDFIKAGTDHGESIPFNERGLNGGPPFIDTVHVMQHGDATTRLGLYLSVLATEYRLLKNNSQDVTGIKHEIFLALNAINRVDYYAESSLPSPQTPTLNGFFIRGDMPKNFIMDNYEHFNYYNFGRDANNEPINRVQVKGFTQTYPHAITMTQAESSDPTDYYPQKVTPESQDQAYYLLMGLTLTNKLVDGNETDGINVFGYGSGQTLLSTEAGNIAGRIIGYIGSDPYWIIRNPNTTYPVPNGPVATDYSYALDNLGGFIKYNQVLPYYYYSYVTGPTAYPYNPAGDFRNSYSHSGAGSFGWQGLAGLGGGFTPDMQGFFNCLAGIGNSVYQNMILTDLNVQATINSLQAQINAINNQLSQDIMDVLNSLPFAPSSWEEKAVQDAIAALNTAANNALNGLYDLLNTTLTYLTPTVLINTTDERLTYNSTGNPVAYWNSCLNPNATGPTFTHAGSEQYFGIYLRDILYPNGGALPAYLAWIGSPPSPGHLAVQNDVFNILNSAPCEGNYNFNGNTLNLPNYPPGQWGTSCFMDRPDPVWNKTSCSKNLGEYSGLDYLLLHNLFYLREGTAANPVMDYITRDITFNLPVGSVYQNTTKETIGAYEFINATNTVNNTGGTVFRAGKQIAWLPGFNSNLGSSVDAIIDPFPGTCNNDAMRLANPNSSSDPFSAPVSNGQPLASNAQQSMSNDPGTGNYQSQAANELQSALNQRLDDYRTAAAKIKKSSALPDNIKIYPNPTSGEFVIDLSLQDSEKADLQISDMIGNVLIAGQQNQSIKLPVDMSKYSKGVYLVKVKFSSGREEVTKLTTQ